MVEDLIRRARRRFLLNETLAQFAFAAAVVVGGFVLDADLRHALHGMVDSGALRGGRHRDRRLPRVPANAGPYATAVQLDENAQPARRPFHRILFFRPSGRSDAVPSIAACAGGKRGTRKSVQLEQAVPFLCPAFALRDGRVVRACLRTGRRCVFGSSHGLDLRAPLTQLLFEDQAIHDAKKALARYPEIEDSGWMRRNPCSRNSAWRRIPTSPPPANRMRSTRRSTRRCRIPPTTAPRAKKARTGRQSRADQGRRSSNERPNGDPIDNGDQQAANDQNGREGANPKAGQQSAKSTSGKNGAPSNKESLLSRLKDAVSNMLSKSDKDDGASSQKNQQSAKNETPSGERGQAGKGAQEKGDSQSDAEGQPDSERRRRPAGARAG